MDNILTRDSLVKKVSEIASNRECDAVKMAKKGKIIHDQRSTELAFINMIIPVVDRDQLYNIQCYITKKY